MMITMYHGMTMRSEKKYLHCIEHTAIRTSIAISNNILSYPSIYVSYIVIFDHLSPSWLCHGQGRRELGQALGQLIETGPLLNFTLMSLQHITEENSFNFVRALGQLPQLSPLSAALGVVKHADS